jgi:hypothetical protein
MRMTVIGYDRPVKDLIDELNATRHVTHTSFKKKSVTLHHNAGVLTHEQVLAIWKTRPASAHFDVDAQGDIAQYVLVPEYAWSTGSTLGNEESINIEMCNSSLAPKWEVSSTTWMSAARLAGWLFAKEIEAPPTAANFFVHHHWIPDTCAGPFIDTIFNQILAVAQAEYNSFSTAPSPTPAPAPTPAMPPFPLPTGYYFGPKTGPAQSVSGYFSYKGALSPWQAKMLSRGWKIPVNGLYDDVTAAVVHQFQTEKGLPADGKIGPQTWTAAWTSPVTP